MGKQEKTTTVALHEQHIWKGVVFAILAAASFTTMSLFGKIIGTRASTDVILFARFFISLLLLLPWIIKNPREAVHTSNPGIFLFRSLLTLLAFACFFYALRFIPLSSALLLNNTFPLFVPIVVWLSVRHHTPHKVWMGIVFGFIGVGLVLKPSSGVFQLASLIGLASGILAAVAIVMIRRLSKTTPVIQILFYNFFICSVATGILLPIGWQPMDTSLVLLLVGVGIFGAAYQFFSTISYAKAPVRITSPLMFLCIIFGVFADWLVWNQIPDLITVTGMICVILGGIITIYFGQKELMRK